MDGFTILKEAKGAHWKEGAFCLFFTLVGALIPVWGGAILLKIFSSWNGWFEFFKHGELAIYSASLLTSTLYLMVKSGRGFKGSIILPILGLLVSAFLFAGVLSVDILASTTVSIDEKFLMKTSWPVYVLSVLGFYFANVCENVRLTTDVQDVAYREFNEFESRFDNMEDK